MDCLGLVALRRSSTLLGGVDFYDCNLIIFVTQLIESYVRKMIQIDKKLTFDWRIDTKFSKVDYLVVHPFSGFILIILMK